ncbi:NCS1 nucleoside transporter [Diaporthe helianthi]|uniref:NCS1 nucleoside transporter n=1 Tax=Diaporthe helianthi TaxID=158607 RepID=A0A2P5I732_DIAHE|nr:NCS1 nucleoside transporter [Diaporthe helianthi]
MDIASGGSATRRFIRSLEVTPPKGSTYAITNWVNADLIPMDSSRRTWNGWNPIVLVIMCILCGWPGGSHHITYTVVCRMAWGMRGSWFAVFFRVMPAVVWDGIEAWWGAQAISTMIGTWSIRWANWEHYLANGTMELKDFIGFITYHFIFLGVMWLPPEKLHRPFHVSFVGFTIVILGLVIWSTHSARGGGEYFDSDYNPPPALAGSIGWASVYGATAVLGNTAVVTMGGSAWCRFASDNRRSMIAQAVACPIFIYAAFALGILVTSASSNVLGEAYWQPFLLLREIQSHYNNSAGARAAVFFASAALALAQVTVNMILNSVAAAMDMASYSPKWLTIRRCSYIIAALGVLSGFGTFYGPISGILVADFWIVRKRLIKMRDLYIGNEESIYWYWNGFNWRAFVAFVVSIAPALPGYIMSCANINGVPNNAMKLSRLGFIIGFVVAVVVYPVLSFISPPRGLGEGVDHHDEDMFILPSAFDQSRPTQGKYSIIEGEVDFDSRDSDKGGADKNGVGAETSLSLKS